MNTIKEFRRSSKSIVLLLAAAQFAGAQTQIDLAAQSKHVDFSGVSSTKPTKVATAIPAVCSIGEMFFDTNAPAGQNLYGCTATNFWSQLGGSGAGAGMASQLLDFNVNNSSGTVQTLGALCSGATPCQIRTGSAFFVLTAPVTATISGAGANGTVFWYLSSAQVMTAGHNSAATLSCSAGCSVATGITSFPPDSVPLWQTTFTANVWDVITPSTMDRRAIFSRNVIAAGSGVSSAFDPTTGIQTVSTDPTLTPRYFSGSGAPALTCAAGRDFYTDKTNLHLYFCDAVNTWKQADPVAAAARTDVQNFVLAGSSPATGGVASPAYTSAAVGTFSATGPNSVAYTIAGLPLAVNGVVMVAKMASPTWTAAAGTVDLAVVATNADGAPAAGNWTLNVYAGCAAANGAFSYGTASTITAAPPSLHNFQRYLTTGLNLPGSCAANSPMQFWVQRTADSGGTTGVNAFLTSMEIVIRGNL
jgi:hypothetical protein